MVCGLLFVVCGLLFVVCCLLFFKCGFFLMVAWWMLPLLCHPEQSEGSRCSWRVSFMCEISLNAKDAKEDAESRKEMFVVRGLLFVVVATRS